MAVILDGKKASEEIKAGLKVRVNMIKEKYGVTPTLSIIRIGSDAPTTIFIRNKRKACEDVGIMSKLYEFPEDASQAELFKLIDELNRDRNVNGIIAQLPFPKKYIDEKEMFKRILPAKDIDGLNPLNFGSLALGNEELAPCTPKGIIRLMKKYGISLAGKDAVIVNRSMIVGKPLAVMMTNRDATVTVCHSRTRDIIGHMKNADILVSAVGKPGFVRPDMVKEGAVVIDVGTNYVGNRMSGDVDFKGVAEKVSFITPVPGGIGPMTVAMVLENIVAATEKQLGV